MPPVTLCSVLPIHALEVFANVVAAATPPHRFVTVGQLCLGCSGLGSAGGAHRAVALAIWAVLCLFHAFSILACIGLN